MVHFQNQERIGRCRNTIRKWLRRQKLNENNIYDKIRRHKLSKRSEKKIVKEFLNSDGISLHTIAAKYKQQYGGY